MSDLRRQHPLASFCHRALAAGSAALVLLLAVLAVAPELHHELHAADETHHDADCAVALFAGGVSLAIDTASAPVPSTVWREHRSVTVREIFLASPRYLRQPERGPPVS